jgi:hypothetical protein
VAVSVPTRVRHKIPKSDWSTRACSRFGSLVWGFAGAGWLGLVVVEGGAW